MSRNKYKTKLPRKTIEGLHLLINTILETNKTPDDDDKLLLATLFEVSQKLSQKLAVYQAESRVSFTPPQAIALRLLYTDYVDDDTTYIGNRLHQLANGIHQWSS